MFTSVNQRDSRHRCCLVVAATVSFATERTDLLFFSKFTPKRNFSSSFFPFFEIFFSLKLCKANSRKDGRAERRIFEARSRRY